MIDMEYPKEYSYVEYSCNLISNNYFTFYYFPGIDSNTIYLIQFLKDFIHYVLLLMRLLI